MPRWTSAPDRYAASASFVPRLGAPLVELLAPAAGERILDLGCGDGALTEELVGRGADVLAVDASEEMVAATRARGIAAERADARDLAGIEGPFDAVLSNAVLHWVPEATQVAASVHRVLRPGGRFVAEMGGHGNVAAVRTGLRAALDRHGHDQLATPRWYFPTPDEQARVLASAGFTVESCRLIARPTPLDAGMAAWLETFCGDVLVQLGPDEAARVVATATDVLADVLRDGEGRWTADYVRLRFQAIRPDTGP